MMLFLRSIKDKHFVTYPSCKEECCISFTICSLSVSIVFLSLFSFFLVLQKFLSESEFLKHFDLIELRSQDVVEQEGCLEEAVAMFTSRP